MTDTGMARRWFGRIPFRVVAIAILWTVIVAAAALWHGSDNTKNSVRLARIQASQAFEKDVIYRSWAAGHGGVYVPISEGTPPNPYLQYIENRDVTTLTGQELTLVNPAYMTRQVHELGRGQYGHIGHITSSNPIRPENAPDEWESRALLAFEQGVQVVAETTLIEGREYLRYMRPLVTTSGCLSCHAAQGYEEGDVRGGISVAIPMEPFREGMKSELVLMSASYGGIWLLGLSLILFGGTRLTRQQSVQEREAKKLQESEQRFRTLFEQSPEVIVVVGEDGTILDCNRTLITVGMERDELIGKHFSELKIFRDSNEKLSEILARCVEGHVEPFDVILFAHTGEEFCAEVHPAIVQDGANTNIRLIVRDISGRRQAEQALRENEELIRTIMDHLPVGVAVRSTDPSTTFYYMNDNFPLHYRTTKDELLKPGGFWEGANKNQDFDEVVRNRLLSDYATETSDDMFWEEVPITNNTEETSFVNVQITPVPEKSLMISTVWDVTERKRIEEQAHGFSRVLEHSLNEIYIFDAETYLFIEVNRGARENLGYSIEELRDMTPLGIKPEYTLETFNELVRPLRDGTVEKVEFTTVHLRKDGTRYPVEIFLQLIATDTPLFVAIILDITDKLKLEEQLRQSQRMEVVGQLTGGVAHDFNNLLQVINAGADMAMSDLDTNHPAYDSLEDIAHAGDRAAKLVSQLLLFGRRQIMRLATLNLNSTISNMLRLLVPTIGEHIRLRWEPDMNIAAIHADASMVEQTLMNLCVNSRDAMPDGGEVTISTRNVILDEEFCELHPETKPGRYVRVSVRDGGCGMDSETLDHIFEPFFTTKEPGQGTGLGLATVYGIIKQHNGALDVLSEPNVGTTVNLYWPEAWSGD